MKGSAHQKKYEMLVYTVESTYLYRKYFNLFT